MNKSIENNRSRFMIWTVISGVLLGAVGVLLLRLGNPPNMGICAACFLRDVAGGLQLFSKPAGLQYLRPEVPGFILGSFLAALVFGEFRSRGGESPAIRFFLGAFVMLGALVFLGCPIRLMERLAAGDVVTGAVGLAGMVAGIGLASFFIRHGFTLGSGRDQEKTAAFLAPLLALALVLIILWITFAADGDSLGILTTKWKAPVLASLLLALVVGFAAQRSRYCTAGGFRDIFLSGDFRLAWGYVALMITFIVGNLAVDAFWPGTVRQFEFNAAPMAHQVHLWNFLGMFLLGLGSILLGGCPFRQMVAAGQGNSDGLITVFGFLFGAAMCHNFGLAAKPSSAAAAGGPATAGMVAVIVGIVFCTAVGFFCCSLWKGRKSL